MEDQRRLEVKVEMSPGHISKRLVYQGTDISVGQEIYGFHDNLTAVGYQVKCKIDAIEGLAEAGQPMYGIVREVAGEGVVIEELQTSPRDPQPGRRVRFERQFFLDHYEVD